MADTIRCAGLGGGVRLCSFGTSQTETGVRIPSCSLSVMAANRDLSLHNGADFQKALMGEGFTSR